MRNRLVFEIRKLEAKRHLLIILEVEHLLVHCRAVSWTEPPAVYAICQVN